MIFYCMRCKKRQEIDKPQAVTLKNGRASYTGSCPECGCKVFKFSKDNDQRNKKAVTPMQKLTKLADNALGIRKGLGQEEIKAKKPEGKGPIKATSKLKWKLLIPGFLLTALGIGMMFLYSQNRENVLVAFLCITMLPTGIYLLYKGWKGVETGLLLVEGEEQTKTTGPVNSLNIYPDRVVFELTENHKGQPQQCLNDSKYYYVHKLNSKTEELEQFILPDQYDYYDPKEYANVLMVRAWRKLNERIASLWQKVAPGVLVIAIVVSGIIFIATTGGGGE